MKLKDVAIGGAWGLAAAAAILAPTYLLLRWDSSKGRVSETIAVSNSGITKYIDGENGNVCYYWNGRISCVGVCK